MKNFLTRNEACEALKDVQYSGIVTENSKVALASIRVCIAGEQIGLDLWGVPVEEARPAFRECEIPDSNSPEIIIENYEAYKNCLAEVYEKFGTKKCTCETRTKEEM